MKAIVYIKYGPPDVLELKVEVRRFHIFYKSDPESDLEWIHNRLQLDTLIVTETHHLTGISFSDKHLATKSYRGPQTEKTVCYLHTVEVTGLNPVSPKVTLYIVKS